MKETKRFRKRPRTTYVFLVFVFVSLITISLYAQKMGKLSILKRDDDETLNSTSTNTPEFDLLHLLNSSGKSWSSLSSLEIQLQKIIEREEEDSVGENLLINLRQCHEDTNSWGNISGKTINVPKKHGTTITLAFVACGDRREEAMTMLKSAVMFSQDASLHLIIFSDMEVIIDLGQDILCFKWKMNALGIDFTFELRLEHFPNETWKEMYGKCATLRLFFSTLLPHTDAVMYIDTDAIVVSNLTELWLEFPKHMKDEKMLAAGPNDEESTPGLYNTKRHVPFYGTRGLQAGILLMNLTQMREFGFEEKAVAANTFWGGKIYLADQDILNIVFNAYPERMHQLGCDYNFQYVHCGDGPEQRCFHETSDERTWCFCNATMRTGARIVHGNVGMFHMPYYPFLQDIYSQFNEFDFLKESPEDLIKTLSSRFESLNQTCRPLTAQMLYGNALYYLQNLY